MMVKFKSILGIVLALTISNSFAEVPSMIHKVALENNVPPELFYALVLAESRSKTQQGAKSWPWTMNVGGHPHFFQTREDAYSFASSLTDRGITNFDTGIAQVNWKWHKERFNHNLWDAFDPYKNLTAAAQHLREQYERPACNKWYIAVGCYHRPSRKPKDIKIATKYANRVLKIWEKIAL